MKDISIENSKKYSFTASSPTVLLKLEPVVDGEIVIFNVEYHKFYLPQLEEFNIEKVEFEHEKDGFEIYLKNKKEETKKIFLPFEYSLIENKIKFLKLINE